MPWLEMKPIEEKVAFPCRLLRRVACLSELCERYGIGRKTG